MGTYRWLLLVAAAASIPVTGTAAQSAKDSTGQSSQQAASSSSSTSSQQSTAAQGSQIQQIIVTARKRREPLIKVPVVENVVGQQQLNQYAISNLKQISSHVPGLLIGSATGSFGEQISLRGIGTSTLNATIDQSVSLNIDGMQMTQGLAYQSAMFDMSQVQVLKGPQALFYGKSSPGGVIAIRTADPTNQFQIISRSGYEFEADQRRQDLIVSGPVTRTLGLRLAARYSAANGFFDNVAQAVPGYGGKNPRFRDFAPTEDWIVRGTALWKPLPGLDARLKLNFVHHKVNGDGGGLQYKSCPNGTAPRPPYNIPFMQGDDCTIDRTIRLVDLDPAYFQGVRNGGTPFNKDNQAFGTLELNYSLPSNLKLTSVTGYYLLHQSVLISGTLGTAAAPALATDTNFRRHDFTEELRLTSDFRGPVNFVVGGFYQDGFMRNTNNLLGNTALPAPPGYPGYPGGNLPPVFQRGYHDIDITAVSPFGQVRWDVTPKLELAAGARWTEERRTHTEINLITGTPTNVPLADPQIKSYDLSPEFTATYSLTKGLTLFASYKQAYKSGSFDTVTMAAANTNTAFGDEKVSGFETGIKSFLLDHRLRLNVAGYRYHYKNLQVGANEVTSGGQVIDRTLNAASATIYGIDLDADYDPGIRGLTLHGGLEWNHARYDQFDNALCWGGQTISEGCNQQYDSTTKLYTAQNLSGHRLVRAPDLSSTFGFDYNLPVGSQGMMLAIGSSTLYSSKYLTNLTDRSDMYQNAYFKTNLSVSLYGPNDGWEFAVIGNDLNNQLTTGNCVNAPLSVSDVYVYAYGGQNTGGTTTGPAGPDELACNVDPGRQVWLRLTLRPLNLF